ncbi:hypothetical protein F4808DRAFT_432049 [Astrocystis sublimbata]|nr:hypothetical protein F4808DRAFT_432049 [Astrocystis sublimbata]
MFHWQTCVCLVGLAQAEKKNCYWYCWHIKEGESVSLTHARTQYMCEDWLLSLTLSIDHRPEWKRIVNSGQSSDSEL